MSRIHLIGLPHTTFDKVAFSHCAFTAKAVRMVEMWRKSGHEVIVYWGGESDEGYYVAGLTDEEQHAFWGGVSPGDLPMRFTWNLDDTHWRIFNNRVIDGLEDHLRPGDLIATVGGAISQPIFNEFTEHHKLEPGVGYEGICHGGTFCCFESYAWMHHRYGAYGINDGRYYDTVIPNAVDLEDFEVGESGGYALFVARLIQRKGPDVAGMIAQRADLPLIVIGAGGTQIDNHLVLCEDGTRIEGESVHYIGTVGPDERKKWMSHAEVLLCPTRYIGPWEGVHAEAMMSGVGVVAPDFGVFTETLPSDWRFRSLADAAKAIIRARKDRGQELRSYANARWGMEACRVKYDAWLGRIEGLKTGGWYD